MNYNYFFIPGRNKDLSTAELKSVLKTFPIGKFQIDAKPEEYILLKADSEVDQIADIFFRLGGFVKYGKILPLDMKLEEVVKDLPDKFVYSLSTYAYFPQDRNVENIHKEMNLEIKNQLRNFDKKVRYIGEGRRNNTSGQLIGNRIIEDGIEITLFLGKDEIRTLGITLGVQDIEGYSHRDLEKPGVDTEMGVLPHKLARIMVNLLGLQPDEIIWDPFCGSGNLLLESLVLGYDVIGTDIDPIAVKNSIKNIQWLAGEYELGDAKYSVFEADITEIDKRTHKKLQNSQISALAFEPYMGPPMKREISVKFAEENLEECATLFRSAVQIAERLKNPYMKLVGVMPSYKTREGWITYRFNELFSKKWKITNFSDSEEGLHWDRSSSIIRRNLIVAKLRN